MALLAKIQLVVERLKYGLWLVKGRASWKDVQNWKCPELKNEEEKKK
jgi:hypothetical protein